MNTPDDNLEQAENCGIQIAPVLPAPDEATRTIFAPDEAQYWILIRGKLLELLDPENYEGTPDEADAFIQAIKPSILKSVLDEVEEMPLQVFPEYVFIPAGQMRKVGDYSAPAFSAVSGQALDILWLFTITSTDEYEAVFLLDEGDYTFSAIGAQSTTSILADWYLDGVLKTSAQSWNAAAALNTIKVLFTATLTAGKHKISVKRNSGSGGGHTQLRLSMIDARPIAEEEGGGH